ncbi:MAG: cupredoxin domain-containing protein [Longimicrobiales bacterium]
MNASRITWLAPLVLVLGAGCGDSPVGQAGDDDAAEQAVVANASLRGDNGGSGHIDILDECDSSDPAWAPTGGCSLRGGKVTFAEFGALVPSNLSLSTVGHPAWTNDPTYLEVRAGKSVKVTNRGGRLHTLTPVAAYGGGRVPLNIGLTPAPECLLAPGAVDRFAVPPGQHITIKDTDLRPGINRLQCCIHPWMRELIRVTGRGHDHGDRG